MRNPALHIKRSDLLVLVSKYGLNLQDVNSIMGQAIKFSIRNRVNVTTKARGKKKADRHVEADTNLVADFNRIYSSLMITNNIKALTISKTSVQYLTLKEVTFSASEFCKLFKLQTEEGFKIYINLGIKLLGNKFSLYRLKGTATRIVEHYRDMMIIKGDSSPEKTDIMEVAWNTAVGAFYKTRINIENETTRVHFIHAKNDADSVNADYYNWMYAQFEKWSYLNSVPAFTQLYGSNAKITYQVYMAKFKKENTSTEEQNYFKQVKNEKAIPIKADLEKTRVNQARLRQSV
jgi:hypothetical protein